MLNSKKKQIISMNEKVSNLDKNLKKKTDDLKNIKMKGYK